jgi:hypothetical protein
MTDDRFEELLAQLRHEHHVPPPTPTEKMWAEIQRRQQLRQRSGWQPARWWPLAAAALLLLGIGIGRSLRPQPTVSLSDAGGTGRIQRVDPYALVAARHLDRAEALLTHFESGNSPEISREQLAAWSRALLDDTRMLLDSPAVDQPTLRSLLGDVELLLALIIQSDGESDPRAIADGLRNSGLLQRLRARTPAETI